jgi:signal peptidase
MSTITATRSPARHRAEVKPAEPAQIAQVAQPVTATGTATATDTAAPTPRSMTRRLLGLAANAALALCVLAFFLIALGPHLFGYRTATMLTGSMEPGIMPGDVVVTVPKPAADVKVGDVISYRIPVEDHRVETHRITKVVHHKDGTIDIQTKGDNNPGVDPWTATLAGDTVWQMTAVVPKLGTAIRMLRSPAVQHGVFWIAFGGLLLLGMSIIWGSSEEDEDSPEGPDAEGDDELDEHDKLSPHDEYDDSDGDIHLISSPNEEVLAA